MRLRLPRIILRLSAVAFAAFGAAFAFFPRPMARTIDLELVTAVARTDFIATYGGFELGFAAFLWMCSRRDEWVRPGLLASGCALAGFSLARLGGILTSDEFSTLMLGVFAMEALGCVVSFWAAALE